MISPDVRIVRAIDRSKLTAAGDASLELFRGLFPDWAFERIGTAAHENGAHDAESDREGLQEPIIIAKMISDK